MSATGSHNDRIGRSSRTSAPKTGTQKADALTARAGKTIVRLKITLRGIKPPIWRRLLIPATMTLGDLHMAIQAAMGWEGDHLHVFDVGGRRYGDRESVDYVADENRITLNRLMKSGVNRPLHLRLRRRLGTRGRDRKDRARSRGGCLSGLHRRKTRLSA